MPRDVVLVLVGAVLGVVLTGALHAVQSWRADRRRRRLYEQVVEDFAARLSAYQLASSSPPARALLDAIRREAVTVELLATPTSARLAEIAATLPHAAERPFFDFYTALSERLRAA